MVQFLSIIFFLGFLQFLLGFSKVPVFCVTLYYVEKGVIYDSCHYVFFILLPFLLFLNSVVVKSKALWFPNIISITQCRIPKSYTRAR